MYLLILLPINIKKYWSDEDDINKILVGIKNGR